MWGWIRVGGLHSVLEYADKSGAKYEFRYVTDDEVTFWEHKLNIADYGVKGLWVVTARDD